MDNAKTHKIGLGLDPQSADPSSPKDGDIQFSDGTARTKGLWIYQDAAWVQLVAATSNLFQTKTLSADFTTASSTITDLTFNNLDIGTTYEVYLQVAFESPNSSVNQTVTINHNGSVIAQSSQDGSSNTTQNGFTSGIKIKFVAAATTVTFVTGSNTSAGNRYIAGDGTQSQTFAQITELSDTAVTTDFT